MENLFAPIVNHCTHRLPIVLPLELLGYCRRRNRGRPPKPRVVVCRVVCKWWESKWRRARWGANLLFVIFFSLAVHGNDFSDNDFSDDGVRTSAQQKEANDQASSPHK